MVSLTSTIDTKIYASDHDKFKIFLIKEGFETIKIIQSPKSRFLKLHFNNVNDLLLYQKFNIENRFLSSNSNCYYYDLDYWFLNK